MTTGEGIFWSGFVLSSVILYAVTKDRWNWKKIGKWLFIALGLLSAMVGAWIGIANYLESQPRVQNELWGLSPGMVVSEVLFKKGKADREEDGFWVYKHDADLEYFVQIKGGKVRLVGAYAQPDKNYKLPSIQGISNSSTQAQIQEKFGAPEISENAESTIRILSYPKYQVFFQLVKDQVTTLGVLDSTQGALKFKDGK